MTAAWPAPPRIRTDSSNPFAHHTMEVRVPAIIEEVLARNPHYSGRVRRELADLAAELRGNASLPPLRSEAAGADVWRRELERRRGESWLASDWFFAETYAYRQIAERAGFFDGGGDPFSFHKREEYASPAHAAALERALSLGGGREQAALALLEASLFGNRIDLSFAASRAHGGDVSAGDWLVDSRARALDCLFGAPGALHLIADNAGTELSLDLALVDFLLREGVSPIVLHLKQHPTFVSDATVADVVRFLSEPSAAETELSRALIARLAQARQTGALELSEHAFWNGPLSLWELPQELVQRFQSARLVLLKGDANYRRALGDALWPPETPFSSATAYFPAPLLALRTLKSDAIVDLAPGVARALDQSDARWRVNGRRGVASLGGAWPDSPSRGE